MRLAKLMARASGIVAVVLLLSGPCLYARDLVFKKAGEEISRFSVSALKKHVDSVDQTVLEPHEDKVARYRGFGFVLLMDSLYGKAWREGDEVRFLCADGYQASVSVKRFFEREALLAYDRLDKPLFTINHKKKNNAKIFLGPVYLVWRNIQDHKRRSQNRAYRWPYQVTEIDLVNQEPHSSKRK